MNHDSISTLHRLTHVPRGRKSPVPLIVVVEGTTDIEFLKAISTILHATVTSFPDLAAHDARGDLIFVPFGGGSVLHWIERFGPLGCREFHVYDRELPPETAIRERAAALVNLRPNCRAAITSKRSLENYLHPTAIELAGGPVLTFGDNGCVAEILAKKRHSLSHLTPWEHVSRRQRRQLVHKAKHWLCSEAVRQMTPELLRRRDPTDEIASWLSAIGEMLAGRQ